MLNIPSDPGRKRAVLIVVVHRSEISPLWISARQFCDSGFEIDAEPFPLKKENACSGWRGCQTPARPNSRRRKKERDEAGFEQHFVRLIAGKILRSADEGKKADEADRQHPAWPEVD